MHSSLLWDPPCKHFTPPYSVSFPDPVELQPGEVGAAQQTVGWGLKPGALTPSSLPFLVRNFPSP